MQGLTGGGSVSSGEVLPARARSASLPEAERPSPHAGRIFAAIVAVVIGGGLALVFLAGCEESETPQQKHDRLAWTAACSDESTLLASTSGSPNSFRCPNQRHRMRVQTATAAGEEIGALVFCECERGDGGR